MAKQQPRKDSARAHSSTSNRFGISTTCINRINCKPRPPSLDAHSPPDCGWRTMSGGFQPSTWTPRGGETVGPSKRPSFPTTTTQDASRTVLSRPMRAQLVCRSLNSSADCQRSLGLGLPGLQGMLLPLNFIKDQRTFGHSALHKGPTPALCSWPAGQLSPLQQQP